MLIVAFMRTIAHIIAFQFAIVSNFDIIVYLTNFYYAHLLSISRKSSQIFWSEITVLSIWCAI